MTCFEDFSDINVKDLILEIFDLYSGCHDQGYLSFCNFHSQTSNREVFKDTRLRHLRVYLQHFNLG